MQYETYDWLNALGLLQSHPEEHHEMFEILDEFALRDDHFAPDRRRMNRSLLAEELQAEFKRRGWLTETRMGDHHVDCTKGRVAVEIEWHSTDKSFGRDLLNFNRLQRTGLIDVGVIITRDEVLRLRFRSSGKRDHGSTSHISKLLSLMVGAAAGDCPVVAVALKA